MTTQRQIDIEFDSLTRENDSPKLIANSKATGGTLLSVIKEQLSACGSFDFCVAFVADGGLQILVETFQELKQRGIKGRLLTSTYLNFNSPDVFRKLLEYDNMEVRVFQGNLHAKGYIFDKGETSTVIVGSSNMTQTALTCNKNGTCCTRLSRQPLSATEERVQFVVERHLKPVLLSQDWIENYAAYRSARPSKPKSKPPFQAGSFAQPRTTSKNQAHKMQQRALEALGVIHRKGETRALLVSATGTGKTFLSAFDVLATKPRRVLFLAHRRRIIDASRASYERLLGSTYTFDTYQTGKNISNATCVFAMCSSVAKHLSDFRPDEFDYIVINEAHRTGSQGYQSIMSHFTPRFYLGMTATPNRTDGYDVFALFNHVIAFQITLQDALAEEMLAPFHYFGIHDLEIDDETIEDTALFGRLTSDERVRHITEKIEEYSVTKSNRRGLIFCNRNAEAKELSRKFNALGYRTAAISGQDPDEVRDAVINRLEAGELEYIFSVDIMNEGVDIPSLNQIIMLRRTDSAIIFIQQLGRGLRLNDGKEYALVLDFIGNYQSNFLVPIALSGDKTYNKDRLRRLVQEGDSTIPGCSTVSFDRISEARIYKAIDGGDFTSVRFLKNDISTCARNSARFPRCSNLIVTAPSIRCLSSRIAAWGPTTHFYPNTSRTTRFNFPLIKPRFSNLFLKSSPRASDLKISICFKRSSKPDTRTTGICARLRLGTTAHNLRTAPLGRQSQSLRATLPLLRISFPCLLTMDADLV